MIVFNATEMTFQVFQRALHLQAQESMNDMNYPLGHRKIGRISTAKSIEGLLLDLHGFTWIYMDLPSACDLFRFQCHPDPHLQWGYPDPTATPGPGSRGQPSMICDAMRPEKKPALAITYFAELCGNSK